MSTTPRLEQPANALFPMVLSELGKETEMRLVQLEKAEDSMHVKLLESERLVSPLHI
jgi:hypothetical protein